jgi:Leucine-rich repeat (LRR) protein
MKYYFNFIIFIYLSLIVDLSFAQTDSTVIRQAELASQHEIELSTKRALFLKELSLFPSDSAFEFNICDLGFHELPDISRFTHLTAIRVSGNQLNKLKLKSKNIKFVTVIDIRDNNISILKIGRAPQLKSVYLGENPLQKITTSLLFDHKLRSMDISKTHIEKLAWWMKYKTSLSELYINQSELRLSNRNIRRMRNIKTLLLARMHIDSLPFSFSKLHKLERLTIGYCSLNKLPSNFGALNNLHTLILYSNAFTEFPSVCYQLESLVHLDLYYNHIRNIPQGIGQLKKLEHLYLSFNQISTLPNDIQELTHLKSFHIHHNNIETAPHWLNNLTELQILDMGYNDIDLIPNLSKLDSLKEVDFQENNISAFPFQFLEMPNTRLIFLANNPFSMTLDEKKKLSKLSKEFAKHNGQLILFKKD